MLKNDVRVHWMFDKMALNASLVLGLQFAYFGNFPQSWSIVAGGSFNEIRQFLEVPAIAIFDPKNEICWIEVFSCFDGEYILVMEAWQKYSDFWFKNHWILAQIIFPPLKKQKNEKQVQSNRWCENILLLYWHFLSLIDCSVSSRL